MDIFLKLNPLLFPEDGGGNRTPQWIDRVDAQSPEILETKGVDCDAGPVLEIPGVVKDGAPAQVFMASVAIRVTGRDLNLLGDTLSTKALEGP